jgi:tRNA pseudouridine55 synthase
MDGLLLVRKPEGPTSHDIVASVRRILGLPRVGHFGTLDPFASGLLLVGVGKATRLFPFLGAAEKAYEGRIRLGVATDTYDRTGTVTSESALRSCLEVEAVRQAMGRFAGDVLQSPPPFSAKKFRGRPLYDYARRGKEVVPAPCRVKVRAFVLKRFSPPDIEFEVACSSGTYVRSLAHDLGQALGCGAHLLSLVRTSVGPYRLADALSLEDLADRLEAGRRAEALIPLAELLPHLPKLVLSAYDADRVKNGQSVAAAGLAGAAGAADEPSSVSDPVRLFAPDGRLLALARPLPDGTALAPFLVLV